MNLDTEPVKLTHFSHGAGCGCKIAPKVLDKILHAAPDQGHFPTLLVGNEGRDDAAVLDLGNGSALISTTDFFMPIVDDAYDFGRVAAANAISDVYAMGGTPLLAVAILGWPVEKLAAELAQSVLEGGRSICREAGIPLAGGHSIDSPEPIFGLAVTGMVQIANLKKNNTAKPGDYLFLTKPLGVGILTTAQKRGLLSAVYLPKLTDNLTTLNALGCQLGEMPGVTAMTDVTGFGLLGHVMEMAAGSELSVDLFYEKIPVLDGVRTYIQQGVFPDATTRNWSSYGEQVSFAPGVNVLEAFSLLPDPQTNGGLLFSVHEDALPDIQALLQDAGLHHFLEPVGRMREKREKTIYVL
jgi:selenide,water dikinase